jgi:hypothetical protein
MKPFYISLAFGALVFLLSIPAYLRRKDTDRLNFWNPGGKTAATKLLKRVGWGLSRWRMLFSLSLFLPSLLVLTGLMVFSFKSGGSLGYDGLRLDMLGGYVLGVLSCFGLTYLLRLRKVFQTDQKQIAQQAANAIARKGSPQVAAQILDRAATTSDPQLRLAAAFSLRYVATTQAIATLGRLGQDSDQAVRKAAASSLENINAVLNGAGRQSILRLDDLCADFGRLSSRLELQVDEALRARLLIDYHHVKHQIDSMVFGQLPLLRADPDLFCENCYCRAEELHYLEWKWVRCKRCQDALALRTGVVEVIGQIGGVDAWDLQAGTLRLPLWDPEARQALGAEIDILEICGGRDFSYDWAIGAVLERLRAFSSTGEVHAKVRLVDQPTLDRNTLKLLRLVDPQLGSQHNTSQP